MSGVTRVNFPLDQSAYLFTFKSMHSECAMSSNYVNRLPTFLGGNYKQVYIVKNGNVYSIYWKFLAQYIVRQIQGRDQFTLSE